MIRQRYKNVLPSIENNLHFGVLYQGRCYASSHLEGVLGQVKYA